MVTIVRRPKPITISRRPKPQTDSSRYGAGWPLRPGFPYNSGKQGYHCIEIDGVGHTFLWRPEGGPLEIGWTCGMWSCSPEVMGKHDYKGECTIVYRAPPSPDGPKFFRRKLTK